MATSAVEAQQPTDAFTADSPVRDSLRSSDPWHFDDDDGDDDPFSRCRRERPAGTGEPALDGLKDEAPCSQDSKRDVPPGLPRSLTYFARERGNVPQLQHSASLPGTSTSETAGVHVDAVLRSDASWATKMALLGSQSRGQGGATPNVPRRAAAGESQSKPRDPRKTRSWDVPAADMPTGYPAWGRLLAPGAEARMAQHNRNGSLGSVGHSRNGSFSEVFKRITYPGKGAEGTSPAKPPPAADSLRGNPKRTVASERAISAAETGNDRDKVKPGNLPSLSSLFAKK